MWSRVHEFRGLHLKNAFVEFVLSFNSGRNGFMKKSLRNNDSRRGNEADGCAPLRGNPHPLFRQFFGERFNEQLQPREHKEQGLGSGIIVTADGYILTGNHVIEGADKVKVALASGQKEYDARIIGADPATDVAVLKIEDGK